MERKIIIGFEPEHGGGDAQRLGRLFAEVLAAAPLVATVIPWPSYLMGPADLQRQVDLETKDRFAAIREHLADLGVQTRAIADPSPAHALNELAEQEDAKAIVLGSPHRGPIGRTLAGNVAESLLHGAPCAVTIAPRGYAEREHARLLHVAVAFDGSAEAWAALETAIGIAERTHGELTVIAVADNPYYGYATAVPLLATGEFHDYEREDKERLLDLALGRTPSGLRSAGRLLSGDAGRLLTEVSGEFDLMVTGSRAYGPLRRTVLGSTTRKLIASSGCPVLVLPRGVGVDPLGLRVRPATTTAGARSSSPASR